MATEFIERLQKEMEVKDREVKERKVKERSKKKDKRARYKQNRKQAKVDPNKASETNSAEESTKHLHASSSTSVKGKEKVLAEEVEGTTNSAKKQLKEKLDREVESPGATSQDAAANYHHEIEGSALHEDNSSSYTPEHSSDEDVDESFVSVSMDDLGDILSRKESNGFDGEDYVHVTRK